MKKIFLSIIFSLLLIAVYAAPIPTDSLFLGQTPPGIAAKVFKLPVGSGLRAVERITITSDCKEIYNTELNTYPPTIERIKCFKYLDNKWQGPFVVFDGFMGASLSTNDSVMYIQKNINSNTKPCAYFSRRTNTGWSTPARQFSTSLQSHYLQETDLKNFYVSSIVPNSTGSADLCKLIIHGFDTTFQDLGMPVSTSAIENDFYIARDESYIIFSRNNSGSASDLYISFKKDNGEP